MKFGFEKPNRAANAEQSAPRPTGWPAPDPLSRYSPMRCPKYAAAFTNLGKLLARRADLEARYEKAIAPINSRPRPTVDAVIAGVVGLEDVPDAHAQSAGVFERYCENDENGPRENGAKLLEERRLVEQQIGLQQEVVTSLRDRVSQEICDEVRDEHKANVWDIIKAIRGMSAALLKHRELIEKLNDHGCAMRLRVMPFLDGHFNLNERDSSASAFIREAEEHDLI